MTINPKVTAGGAGTLYGGALVTVVLYLLKVSPPPEIVAALVTLVAAPCGVGLAWLTSAEPHTTT
jgi:hypothetical protein